MVAGQRWFRGSSGKEENNSEHWQDRACKGMVEWYLAAGLSESAYLGPNLSATTL